MNAPLLTVEHLHVLRSGQLVVRDLSLTLEPGEMVLVGGHNGSGKSTLLHALAGLLPVASGLIRWRSDVSRRRRSIMLQDASVFLDLNVVENVAAGVLGKFRLTPTDGGRLRTALEVAAPELRGRTADRCEALSGGQRRLAGFARTVMSASTIYLLDEPTLGLARPVADRLLTQLRDKVRQEGATAVVVEHGLEAAASVATRLCILRRGGLAYDGAPTVVADKDRMRDLYL